MPYSQPIVDLIRKRTSVRTYLPTLIDDEKRNKLNKFIETFTVGPFGGKARFKLIAAKENKSEELRNLGTYGFIKGATGYIISAIKDESKNLEDLGYQMERLILYATDLGLGTCWLGGTFTKSSFAAKMNLISDELIPAVTAIGIPSPKRRRTVKLTRKKANSDRRIDWEQLFFDETFGNPLKRSPAEKFNLPLEMLRIAPSASNHQPWRIVRKQNLFHLYMHRSPGYNDRRINRWFTNADMQRIDMGIAMCHFELTAMELGLPGEWVKQAPEIELPEGEIKYLTTWKI